MSIALVDNEISQAALEFSTVLSLLKRLEATMEEGNNAILQQNNDISKSEAEIGRNNALIERKQTQIDQMNKKIELKLSKVGGVSVTIASDVHALICTHVLVQEHVQYVHVHVILHAHACICGGYSTFVRVGVTLYMYM